MMLSWRRVVTGVGLVILLASNVQAQKQNGLNTANVIETILPTFACEGSNCAGLTVDNTAGGVVLTAATYNPTVTDLPSGFSRAQVASCTNTGAKIWITTTPSVTLATGKGRPIVDGGSFIIYGYTDISNFHAIRDAAISSVLNCDYGRQP